MKALRFAWKNLLEAWREPKVYGLLLFFPALFVVVYYIAFGQTGKGLAQMLTVSVVNQDAGPAGVQLVEALRGTTFDGQPVLDVTVVADRREAEAALREYKDVLMLIIPSNFSQVLQEVRDGRVEKPITLQLVGDPALDSYVFANSFVPSVVDEFVKKFIGWQTSNNVAIDFVPNTGSMADFQIGVPGLLVFAVLMGVVTAAMVPVREDVTGTLHRLQLTRARASDVILGVALAHVVLAVLQILIAFGIAVLCGFRTPGSLALAIGIGALVSLAATGLGLIVACFAHSPIAATLIGSAVFAPVAFLSGALFPVASAPIATLWGHDVSWLDILPARHAVEALQRVLIYGDGLSAIAYPLSALAVLSLVYLGIGVGLYQWLRIKA